MQILVCERAHAATLRVVDREKHASGSRRAELDRRHARERIGPLAAQRIGLRRWVPFHVRRRAPLGRERRSRKRPVHCLHAPVVWPRPRQLDLPRSRLVCVPDPWDPRVPRHQTRHRPDDVREPWGAADAQVVAQSQGRSLGVRRSGPGERRMRPRGSSVWLRWRLTHLKVRRRQGRRVG